MTVQFYTHTGTKVSLFDVGAVEEHAQDFYFVADHQKRDIEYHIDVMVYNEMMFKVDDMVIPKNWIKDLKVYPDKLDPEELPFE